jgi:hypothetical protein
MALAGLLAGSEGIEPAGKVGGLVGEHANGITTKYGLALLKRLQSLKGHPGVFNDGRMARIVDEWNAIIRDFAAAERDGVVLSLPIRLMPISTKCRVLPVACVEFGIRC